MEGGRRMRITLDLPNEMVCAFVGFVYYDDYKYSMGVTSLDSDDLKDGNVIKIPKKQEEEE